MDRRRWASSPVPRLGLGRWEEALRPACQEALVWLQAGDGHLSLAWGEGTFPSLSRPQAPCVRGGWWTAVEQLAAGQVSPRQLGRGSEVSPRRGCGRPSLAALGRPRGLDQPERNPAVPSCRCNWQMEIGQADDQGP